MDGYSSKRVVATSRAPRKGYNGGSRDANSSQDNNVQFCNRIGCNGRIKYGFQNMKTGSPEKSKSSQSSLCSLNGNGVIETSSRSGSGMAREKNPYVDSKRKLSSSQLGFDQSESSQSGDSEATQSMSSPVRSSTSCHSGSMNKSGQVSTVKTGNVPSSVRARKKIQHTSGSNTQTTAAVSSTSKSPVLGTLNGSNRSSSLKNLKCNSISDAAPPPSSSSSESKSPSKNVMKKMSLEEDSSLSGKGRQTTAAATFGGRAPSSSGGASTSDCRRSSCISGSDSSVSASGKTGGSATVNKSRMRLSYRQNGRNTPCFRESAVRISQYPDSEPPRNVGRPRLLQLHSTNASTSGSSSYSLPSRNDGSQFTWTPYTSAEEGYSHLVNRDMLQRYNMDGIAEVLLALERIEQEEGMTHEVLGLCLIYDYYTSKYVLLSSSPFPQQILNLENSLYLSGLNLYDRHRDMRLDIDDMSYEELLALGDRMGTVSTALSKEELLKCIKRSIYQVTPPEIGPTELGEDGDDVKCCICQEDYVKGDEIGELVECEHVYHMGCVEQWLRLKNWCPICKTAAAAPTQSSSSS